MGVHYRDMGGSCGRRRRVDEVCFCARWASHADTKKSAAQIRLLALSLLLVMDAGCNAC